MPAFSKDRILQTSRWVTVVGGCALFELGFLKVMNEDLRVPLWVASAVAAEVFIIVKFLLSDRLVFRHARPQLSRLTRYQGASIGAFAISWAVINGSVALFGLSVVQAFIVGSGAAFAWSFVSSFFWVWAGGSDKTSLGVAE